MQVSRCWHAPQAVPNSVNFSVLTAMRNMQVIEFVQFKQRLDRSHSLAVTRAEQSFVKLRKAVPRGFASMQSVLQDISQSLNQSSAVPSVEELRFNEDLSTRPAWLPPPEGSVEGSLIDWWHEQLSESSDTGTVRPTNMVLSLIMSVCPSLQCCLCPWCLQCQKPCCKESRQLSCPDLS